MNDFEEFLESAEKARDLPVDLNEYANSLAHMIGIQIRGILEQHQKEYMSLDENLRDKIKEDLRAKFEEIMKDVEDYPKGAIL